MKNGSSRRPANTWMSDGEPSTVLTRPLTTGGTDTSVVIVPVRSGGTGPRRVTCWFGPVPSNVNCNTRSSIASPVLSILIWYRMLGSNAASTDFAGLSGDDVVRTNTRRSELEPGNTYTSLMSSRGLSSTSGVSWWSDARAFLMRAAVPAPDRMTSAATSLPCPERDRKSTRLNSSHGYISYAVFCLKKKKTTNIKPYYYT